MLRIPGIRFSEKFLDCNEAAHNVGELEVLEVLSRPYHVSGAFLHKMSGRTRRVAIGRTDDAYIAIVFEIDSELWTVLSARPASNSERKRYKEHVREND
jgi:uncharacterized DUF497 family protein